MMLIVPARGKAVSEVAPSKGEEGRQAKLRPLKVSRAKDEFLSETLAAGARAFPRPRLLFSESGNLQQE